MKKDGKREEIIGLRLQDKTIMRHTSKYYHSLKFGQNIIK